LIYSPSELTKTTNNIARYGLDEDMKKTVIVDNFETPFMWNSYLSPSSLWRMNGETYNLILNGVTMGYELKNDDNKMVPVLIRIYQFGLLLYGLAFTVPLVLLIVLRRSKR